MNDRSDGVEERERILAGELGDRFRERGRGEGAGGDDHALPVRRRQRRDLLAANIYQRMGRKRGGDGCREPFAIDRQCSPGRDLMEVGGAHDERAEPAHLLVQEADGVVFPVVGAE